VGGGMSTEKLCIECSSWTVGTNCAVCGATKPSDSPSRLALTPEAAADRRQQLEDQARRVKLARREAGRPSAPTHEATDDRVRCRKCGSEQFVGVPKGYSVMKGLVGWAWSGQWAYSAEILALQRSVSPARGAATVGHPSSRLLMATHHRLAAGPSTPGEVLRVTRAIA
jgi:hypothetical protein